MKTKPFLKSMALVICCLTSFVLVSCDKDDDKPNLKISPNKVEVAVGKTVTVSVSNEMCIRDSPCTDMPAFILSSFQ